MKNSVKILLSGSMHDDSSSMDETSDDNSTDDDATSSRTARSTYDGPSSRSARLTWAERQTQVENSSFNSCLKNADENEMDGTSLWDPTCYEGRQFRWRFRVPYTIFLELVGEYKLDCSKLRSTGPYDERLLVLGALRVLGSGSPYDLIEELNYIDKETNRKFFHRFVNWGRRKASKWIYLPRTEAEICHVVDVYKSLGYPGALGSADGSLLFRQVSCRTIKCLYWQREAPDIGLSVCNFRHKVDHVFDECAFWYRQ
jgi:hypothetical protein